MSSVVLPSRGQCIQITDDNQPCRCQWFFPPESLLLDQDICGLCGHGIHAHVDYVSMVVNRYPANHCAAFAQKTHLMQSCTCAAQCYEHIATDNPYRLSTPWTVLDYFNPGNNDPSFGTITSNHFNGPSAPFPLATAQSYRYSTPTFTGDAADIPFSPPYMPYPSPNANPSYLHGDPVVYTPTPQPVVQLAIPQFEAQPHSAVEDSYRVQYRDDNFRVNVQDSRGGFPQDYPYSSAHDMGT